MYTQEITRRNRTAFIIAIDQSTSMQESSVVDSRKLSKADMVTILTNRILEELVARARREDGIHNYYDIAVIGYSNDRAYPLLDSHRNFIPVHELSGYDHPSRTIFFVRRLPSGQEQMFREVVPMWIEPKAEGSTPIYDVMSYIHDCLKEWCSNPHNADSFPPVIFNITDGESSDCSDVELREISQKIKNLSTTDGNVILTNIHINVQNPTRRTIFPTIEEVGCESRYARLLAECSSVIPEQFNDVIRAERGDFARPPFRAMGFNASMAEVLEIFNIGSRNILKIQ